MSILIANQPRPSRIPLGWWKYPEFSVHVPPSLAATCQLCELSGKMGREDYIGEN